MDAKCRLVNHPISVNAGSAMVVYATVVGGVTTVKLFHGDPLYRGL